MSTSRVENPSASSSEQQHLPHPTDRAFVVAIDGPAGSGKSSMCKAVCNQLGWSYLSTGLLYRAVGVLIIEHDIQPASLMNGDEECAPNSKLDNLLVTFDREVCWDQSLDRLYMGKRVFGEELLSPEAGMAASQVSQNRLVRKRLLPTQRRLCLASRGGVLVDGRDIGTVVFPDAPLKVFLTASLEERARRRWVQIEARKVETEDSKRSLARLPLRELREKPSYKSIKSELAKRDHQDIHRPDSPLRKAKDAKTLDTSDIDAEQAQQQIVAWIEQQRATAKTTGNDTRA